MSAVMEWVKIKNKKMAPLVIDFLVDVESKKYKFDSTYFYKKHPSYPRFSLINWFYGIDLKRSNPILLNSGDRIMRQLVEDGLVNVECIFQADGIYKLRSDIFELEKARKAITAGGFEREAKAQIDIFSRN